MAAKFTAMALHIAKSESLSKCTPISIINAMLEVAAVGLDPDPNAGHVYFVPYGVGRDQDRVYNVQMQIGYKGYLWLAHSAGWDIRAQAVYTVDTFTRDASDPFNPRTIFIEGERQLGNSEWVYQNLKGVRVAGRHVAHGLIRDDYIPKDVIERLRLMSPSQKMPTLDWMVKKLKPDEKKRLTDQQPVQIWQEHYEAMAFSKAIRKFISLIPRNSIAALMDKMPDHIEGKVVGDKPVADDVPLPQTAPLQLPEIPKETLNTWQIADEEQAEFADVDPSTGEMPGPLHQEMPEPAGQTASLKTKIKNAKTKTALDKLIATLSDAEKNEHQDTIDEAYDLFR